MSSISDRGALTVCLALLVVLTPSAKCRPQQQSYLPPPSGQQSQNTNNLQTFYVPPAGGQQQQHQQHQQHQQFQLPFAGSPSNQQQQFLTQPPIQLQIPIPNDGVEEKKIYVQLPPQQHFSQQPQTQYRYPPRKHYKIILVRSPPPPTPPPAPVLPEIEEQTLVYVLVQKPDTPSVAELQQQHQQSFKLNKPEVYFIKYKANEQRAGDGSLGSSSSGSSPEAIEKSIEQQVSNNLEGASGNGGGGGYSYDGNRKREAKNLKQDDEEAKTVTDENQK